MGVGEMAGILLLLLLHATTVTVECEIGYFVVRRSAPSYAFQ